MTEFVSIGLDIRRVGAGEPYSADANIWNQHIQLYTRAKLELNIKENVLQLLHPKTMSEGLALSEMVRSSKDAVLVSLEMLNRVFEAFPYRDLTYPPIESTIIAHAWQTLGLDICDIDGFFSFFDMTYSSDKSTALLGEDRLAEALVIAQAANLEMPRHAPFVVIRLKMQSGDI